MAAVAWKNTAYLRGLAVCMVILNHSVQGAATLYLAGAQHFDPEREPISLGLVLLVRLVTPFCLPAFIFASGFLSYRVVRTWPQSLRIAWTLARTYLIWSMPAFIVFAIHDRRLDVQRLLVDIVLGGPFPTYWFLPLMVQLFLVFPLLVSSVEKKPLAAGLGALALQVLVWVGCYAGVSIGTQPPLLNLVLRPLPFVPALVAGLLASRYAGPFVRLLERRRKVLGFLALGLLGLVLVEGVYVAYRGGWSKPAVGSAVMGERIPATLFAWAIIGLVMGRESKAGRMQSSLTSIGVASLGFFLTSDIFLTCFRDLAWHLPAWLPWGRDRLGLGGVTAPWVLRWALTTLPGFCAAGLIGPLFVIRLANRYLDRWVRYLM